ncbi:unnamed protein product [Oppiella nova]|uniref:Uncharacterized protein n=1 Tax=Oppiella nova TaxID=334625 RepID=A0A7R9MGS3_9ACAR|nr:unnamed protein product [Oppiella nova]CAG2176961.1 unnamed protein product [Oppiella nova]
MNITYGLSTYGKPIVINEGTDGLPAYRLLFVFLIITWFIFLKIREILIYRAIRRHHRLDQQQQPGSIIHTVHYVDNICRPVDYYEPKYLYQKYVISTMEITLLRANTATRVTVQGDDDEIESFNMQVKGAVRQRSRSQTPTK